MIGLGLVGVGPWGRRYIETIGRRADCRVMAIARRTKARRFAVSMRSGRTLVYDDLQPVRRQLTDDGEPVAIDSAPALDSVLTHFCGQIETWRRRELATSSAVEWLELSAAVSPILDTMTRN